MLSSITCTCINSSSVPYTLVYTNCDGLLTSFSRTLNSIDAHILRLRALVANSKDIEPQLLLLGGNATFRMWTTCADAHFHLSRYLAIREKQLINMCRRMYGYSLYILFSLQGKPCWKVHYYCICCIKSRQLQQRNDVDKVLTIKFTCQFSITKVLAYNRNTRKFY